MRRRIVTIVFIALIAGIFLTACSRCIFPNANAPCAPLIDLRESFA